jgi:DNA topoisomerase-1
VAALKKMDERIAVQKTNALDKDEGKGASSFCFFSPSPSSLTEPIRRFIDVTEISLGTSKINYLDPRISIAWCKANDVPINKIFTKTLLEKFTWAVSSSCRYYSSRSPC